MALQIKEGYTFDDVLLVPRHSKVLSRATVDLSVKLSKGLEFKHPIVPANMKTVTGYEMAKCIADSGGLAILHRFMSLETQLDIVNKFVLATAEETPDYMRHIGVSLGVKESDYETVKALYQLGAKIFCIDVAHGDSKLCIDMVQYISKTYPEVFLIAGNVSTPDGAARLWEAGADAVKVGVGPGSLCSTRIETGNGVPQLSALEEIFEKQQSLTSPHKQMVYEPHGKMIEKPPVIEKPIYIISDGGAKNSGDLVKALCFSDMIMTGNIFAGADETPGDKLLVDGKQFKRYDGSSTHKTNHIEGVTSLVPVKGKTIDIINLLCEGICSGLSYQGCNNLIELKEDPQFVRITNAGLKESHPHDVLVIK